MPWCLLEHDAPAVYCNSKHIAFQDLPVGPFLCLPTTPIKHLLLHCWLHNDFWMYLSEKKRKKMEQEEKSKGFVYLAHSPLFSPLPCHCVPQYTEPPVTKQSLRTRHHVRMRWCLEFPTCCQLQLCQEFWCSAQSRIYEQIVFTLFRWWATHFPKGTTHRSDRHRPAPLIPVLLL